MKIAFNTLKFAHKLQAAGFPEHQAIALTEAQNEAFMETTDHIVATKADITQLRNEFKADMYSLKQDMDKLRMEVHAEIAKLRTEVRAEIAKLRTEVHAEIAHIKYQLKLHNWMIGFVLTGIATLIIKSFFG